MPLSLSSDRQHSDPVPVLRPSAQCPCPCPQTVSTVPLSLAPDRQQCPCPCPQTVSTVSLPCPQTVSTVPLSLSSDRQHSAPFPVLRPSAQCPRPCPQTVSTVPLSLSSDRQHSAPVPGSFILLQKHTHPLLLKLKSLASVLSGTVQQSSCTLCLLTSVRFNPPMHPSELFNWPLPIPVTFILCTLVCTLASVVWEEYSILSTFVFLYISWTYFC